MLNNLEDRMIIREGLKKMLKLSTTTKLSPIKVLELAEEYFINNLGLEPIERLAHLHSQEGFIEIKVSGLKLVGKEEYTPRITLDEITNYVNKEYGFHLEKLSLHLHSNLGHVDVIISNETPTQVNLDSYEFDYQIKEFVKKIT